MKKIALLSLCFASLYATAQNIKIETGKKITGTSSGSINMDMGAAGGEMKIESSNTFVINVTGADAGNYKAENTITKMKMSQDGAGQSMSYDSENKADADSEMGKEAGKTLNVPAAILIDKNTGEVKDASPEKDKSDEGDNPFADIMGGSKTPADMATGAFFVIPAGKKAGDKWSDSSASPIQGLTAKKDYELQSIKDGIATVLVKTATKGTISKEVQGMQIEITMNGTSDMTLTTDTKTGLVRKNVTTGSTEGSMDVMGQTMNFTMKASATSAFE